MVQAQFFAAPSWARSYKEGALFPSGLEWLRRLSVNVPAFISGTIWERDFWNGYPYGNILPK